MDPSFQEENRLFALSFEDINVQNSNGDIFFQP